MAKPKLMYSGVNIPTVGTKQWMKQMEKALQHPGFKVKLFDKCLEPFPEDKRGEIKLAKQVNAAKKLLQTSLDLPNVSMMDDK